MSSIVDFMKTILNHSASSARVSAEEAKVSIENIKQHFQNLQGQDTQAHTAYMNKHHIPRQEREEAYTQYLETKAGLLQEWRATKSKTSLHHYLTFTTPEINKPTTEIYTKFL